MHLIDWTILCGTLLFIVLYGMWKTRNISSSTTYLVGDKDLKWYTIGLSVMATQASAITFLSTPGQAYEDGMRFAQFYFGLPIAMVILCIFILPIYYRLNVQTAYEFLENRFDLKTRSLTAILFLIQRGLAAGITIFAPSIILSTIMSWNLALTNILIGSIVIIYTVFGGSKAVSQTQKHQMLIILAGMVFAFIVIVNKLPPDVGITDALNVAGKMDKLNVVNFKFDISDKYNIWSGIIAGTFLFLSYFGTDQSQVQRYLGGKSLTESRLGLLFNGLIKVPMQFLVLLVGIMVFMFYQFNPSPLHFNPANVEHIRDSGYAEEYADLEKELIEIQQAKSSAIHGYLDTEKMQGHDAALPLTQDFNTLMSNEKSIRQRAKSLIVKMNEDDPTLKYETEDTDYVFISFITDHLPIGLIGLLLAVIFSAAMSSTASELNALATTSLVDIYRRNFRRNESDKHYLRISKLFTILWGLIALGFAAMASLFDNLIEAVNIIGSIFYGTILGVFVAAFFFKRLKGTPVFIAALIAEIFVIIVYTLDKLEFIEFAYLWLNLLGCLLVVLFAYILQSLMLKNPWSQA